MVRIWRVMLGAVVGLGLNSLVFGAEAPTYVNRVDAWYSSDEGKTVVKNILTWQMPTGGWPKAYDAATANKDAVPHVVPHNSTPAAATAVAKEGVSSWDMATIDNS